MIPLQIAFEGGLEESPAMRARIEKEAAKLDRFAGHILGCHVAVIGRSGRRRHGDLFAVRLRITRAGLGDVVIDRNPDEDHAHEDVYVAIRDAFNAARRRLQDRERRSGGQVKRHEPQPHGRVSRVDRDEGFGFIEAPDGREVYFHRNAVPGDGFEHLQPGDEVRFIEASGDKGPRASTVRPVHALHLAR